jgi:probable phosphoglycerate mutase
VASNFARAIETAEILAPALGDLPVIVDAEMGEHDPGPDFDGMAYEAYLEQHGFPDWENDPFGVSFAGGETLAEFHHRVGRGLHRLVENNDGRTVVVVCHGGVVDATLRMALRTPPTGIFELHTRNTSITELVLVAPGRWKLERYNDHAHLVALEASSS